MSRQGHWRLWPFLGLLGFALATAGKWLLTVTSAFSRVLSDAAIPGERSALARSATFASNTSTWRPSPEPVHPHRRLTLASNALQPAASTPSVL
jgi:hypothetical protein